MALPTTIDPTAPLGSAAVSDGDAQLRAFKQAIVDFFGVPADPTSLTAAAFSISAAGVVTFVSAPDVGISAPATPTANRLYRDLVVKGWVRFRIDGTIDDDVNVSSITDSGVGDWTVNWATVFANTTYAVFAKTTLDSGVGTTSASANNDALPTAAAVQIISLDSAGALRDPDGAGPRIFVLAIGDQ